MCNFAAQQIVNHDVAIHGGRYVYIDGLFIGINPDITAASFRNSESSKVQVKPVFGLTCNSVEFIYRVYLQILVPACEQIFKIYIGPASESLKIRCGYSKITGSSRFKSKLNNGIYV